MKTSSLSLATGVIAITSALLGHAFAGPVEEKIVQPPAAPVSPWEFRLEAYGWLTGLDGTAGVNGFNTDVDVSFGTIAKKLDFAAAMQLEVRKDRWGVLLDGFYTKLGFVGDPPGPLYSSASADLQ